MIGETGSGDDDRTLKPSRENGTVSNHAVLDRLSAALLEPSAERLAGEPRRPS